ncbi:tail fiber domain-containing protein [Nitrospirillum sp. BR 11163]|uniref:tail fiber domain-containing protein n=1 Tax=Nitrospirillum sp. BR 11163 TaxID=3104323 RepID=UPI002AFF28C6|nr:tail fiber domain-containing protein [Nitrospirillum sp. BR 11163]MEA1677477.1 tail fiber domain-containing protein [Nitrospirillum sp. BR 11163]
MLKGVFCGLVLSALFAVPSYAACPNFPYTFTNGQTADANAINSNFTSVTTCFAPINNPSFMGSVTMSGALNITGATATGGASLIISGYGAGGHNYGSAWKQSSDALPFPLVFFNAAGSVIGTIATTSSGTSYNTTSDRRLKENIRPTSHGLDIINKIEIDDYNYLNDPKKTPTQGVIAQDLYKIYPQAVSVGGDNPAVQPWGVDYGRLTPLLVRAIQEQQAEIEALKTEIAALKNTKPAAH